VTGVGAGERVPTAVPFLDLARLHESIREELEEAFAAVVSASAFVGPSVATCFETVFAAAHERAGAVGCGSGTDAITLALAALGIGRGDEVIVPSLTFVATLEAVVHAGATPVIADVDPHSLLLSAEEVDAARTRRTRAVVPVHLYGHVVPFSLLEDWRRAGLLVVEDAAQAHLARWGGQSVGSVGHAATFSFYPSKNLAALGDAGAVLSDDLSLLERVAILRDHGKRADDEHEVIGWNARIDGLQAAFLTVKLGHLAAWTKARSRLAEQYRARLPELVVPWEDGAVHHLLVVRIPGGRRDAIARALAARGIDTRVHYPLSLSQQPSCRAWARRTPHAEAAAAEVLSLPLDPFLSEEAVDYVCTTLSAAL
jgi:dTDP-4-amino-4,6-dideoxygalactose transaminase